MQHNINFEQKVFAKTWWRTRAQGKAKFCWLETSALSLPQCHALGLMRDVFEGMFESGKTTTQAD